MNRPPTNPRVERYVLKITRGEVVTYLSQGKEVGSVEEATHYGAPGKVYSAMEVYGTQVAARSPADRKAMFMELEDTWASLAKVVR